MKRHKHSLSHYRYDSLRLGELQPVGCIEVLPGDTFQHSTSMLLRCMPLVAPVMHQVDVRVHHWFVPHRLVWEHFEAFITGQAELTVPTVSIDFTNPGHARMASALGLGNTQSGGAGTVVSALPFRGYNLIWNEYYRDQDLVTAVPLTSLSAPRLVAWHKDYFTTARPWPQKGSEVTVPVRYTDNVGNVQDVGVDAAPGGVFPYKLGLLNPTTPMPFVGGLGANVRDLRMSLALQRYDEARARYGSRYTEYLRYLGVRSSDARLQRPEYLGGGKQQISFSEVLQTAEGTEPVGTMAGHGIAALRSNRYRRFFEEHGYVFTLVSVVPRNLYANVSPRHWFKSTKEDFYQRELQLVGQQPIWQAELGARADNTGVNRDSNVFGWAGRYSEYTSHPSTVNGEFISNYKEWTFSRSWSATANTPALNASFVQCLPTTDPFAVPGDSHMIYMAHQRIGARRLVSSPVMSRVI